MLKLAAKSIFDHRCQISTLFTRRFDIAVAHNNRLNHENTSKEEDRLALKTVHVRTSIGRWIEKISGLDFDVSYLDIYPQSCDKSKLDAYPVILYLTGFIGSHKPVKHFLLKLADHTNCRVLAPLWPGLCDETRGHTLSDNDLFAHTVAEYAELATDFLTAMEVVSNKKTLQSIVSHSGGCLSACLLSTRTSRVTKSLVFMCPSSPRPRSITGFTTFHKFIAHTWQFPKVRATIKPLISTAVYLSPFRGFLSVDAAGAIARAALRVNTSEVLEAAKNVNHCQIPLLLIYSDKDEWISLTDTLTMAEHLGVHPDSKKGRLCTARYSVSPRGMYEKLPPTHRDDPDNAIQWPIHVVRIVKGGSHWPQRICPDLVLEKISNFFKYM